MEQGEVQHQVVGKGRFARVGLSDDDRGASRFELHEIVERAPSHLLTRLDAVLPDVEQLLAIVGHRLHTCDRTGLCVVDALHHGVGTVRRQHVVGILFGIRLPVFLFDAPFHDAAAGLAEILCQLRAQLFTCLVHVACQVDGLQVVEVGVAEAVERAQLRVGAVAHRYHVVVAQFHECQRVHHALGDDDALLSDAGVDVPGDDLAVGLHGKQLVGGLILDVHHLRALAEGEGQAVALHASDDVACRTDTCLLRRLRLDAPLRQVVDGHGVERFQMGGARQFPVLFPHWLVLAEGFHLRADDEVEAAVVALAQPRGHVEPDTWFVLMRPFA